MRAGSPATLFTSTAVPSSDAGRVGITSVGRGGPDQFVNAAGVKDVNMKPIKIPGPDHPITITPARDRITVIVAGRSVADTREALTLKEAAYSPVHYIPRKDVDMTQLQRTSHQTYCPYKGECAYYSIPAGAERSVNAVWTYEAPYAAVAEIREYLAFYSDRVDAIQIVVEN
jgi:uncharacterized protein (DUF427 family)